MGPRLRGALDPEKVLQEATVRALASLATFQWRGEGSFRAWLEGIASHLILNAARAESRRRVYRLKREPAAGDVSPSRQQRRIERFERLQRSVESLPRDHRTVVRLARIEGLRIREIAERLGRSEAAIKAVLFKAMKRLRDSFGDTDRLSLPDHELEIEESGDAG